MRNAVDKSRIYIYIRTQEAKLTTIDVETLIKSLGKGEGGKAQEELRQETHTSNVGVFLISCLMVPLTKLVIHPLPF